MDDPGRNLMEGLGRLAWGAAHEFNNVLSAILCCCRLLEGRPGFDDAAGREIAEIKEAVRRGTELTRLLQVYMRREATRAEPVDLDWQISGLVSLLHHNFNGFVGLRYVPADRPMRVLVDPLWFTETMLEILTTARRSMIKGGKIVLEAAAGPGPEAQIELEFTRFQPDPSFAPLVRLVDRLEVNAEVRPVVVSATDSVLRLRICLPLAPVPVC